MSDTNVVGAVAEQAIVLAATKLGVPVLRPVADHGRTDLALEVGGRLWRVQCKSGRLNARGDVVVTSLRTSACTPRGYVRTNYSAADVDLPAVYCPSLDRCFLLPIALVAGRSEISLRLRPARNRSEHVLTLQTTSTSKGL